jgi:Zn-dependent protease
MDFEEALHIIVSVLTVSLAFTYVWTQNYELGAFAGTFLAILVTVGAGFVLHELGHRYMAHKYGCYAAYRAFTWGLILALVMAFTIGIVFAAPGAVFIMGPRLNRRQNGEISVAGPMVNALLALVFWIVAITIPGLRETALLGKQVNVFLGVFNMIPVNPLDGGKVIAWGIVPWAAGLAVLLAVGLLPA